MRSRPEPPPAVLACGCNRLDCPTCGPHWRDLADWFRELAERSRTGGPPPPPRPVRRPCVHEGAVLEFSRCLGEAGHVRDCDRHDRCVCGPHPRATVRVCLDCPDYDPPPDSPAAEPSTAPASLT